MRPTPIIAISATNCTDRGARSIKLNEAYAHAVAMAGGVPVVLPPGQSGAAADLITDVIDGLLLSGGADIDPVRYRKQAHRKAGPFSADRDTAELALIAAARARRLPLLAICRGMQLLNVAHGGTLVQDIEDELPGALDHTRGKDRRARVHQVKVEAGSRLAEAMGARQLVVNSIHHQAPATVGAGLRVVARAPDGIIEALEWSGDEWWAAGVQWHPEELVGDEEGWERALFEAFVRAASRHDAPASG